MNFNKLKKTDMVPTMSSDHYRIILEINKRKLEIFQIFGI